MRIQKPSNLWKYEAPQSKYFTVWLKNVLLLVNLRWIKMNKTCLLLFWTCLVDTFVNKPEMVLSLHHLSGQKLSVLPSPCAVWEELHWQNATASHLFTNRTNSAFWILNYSFHSGLGRQVDTADLVSTVAWGKLTQSGCQRCVCVLKVWALSELDTAVTS